MTISGRRVALSFMLAVFACGAAIAAETSALAYKLHAGDKLVVGLYDDAKLPPSEMIIAPDGTFAFPLIGEVTAGGKTTAQVRAEMETRLKKYVSEPSVTVSIKEIKGNVVYVIGQVNNPGQFVMNPELNVMQALSIAGGMNAYAAKDNIFVLRSSSAGQKVLPFRYSAVSSGKNLEQNIGLESGDVVVVP